MRSAARWRSLTHCCRRSWSQDQARRSAASRRSPPARVDVAGVPGAAHGDVGELAPAAVVEDVGDVHRRALRAMCRDRVSVAEPVRPDLLGPHPQLPAVGGDGGERLRFRVDGGHSRRLGGDPGALRPRCEGDHPVAGAVGAPAGADELRSGEPPGPLPQLACGGVQRLDVLAPVGEEEGVAAGVDILRPGPHHRPHGVPAVGHAVDPTVAGVPGHGLSDAPVAQLGERGALGRVGLAEVVAEGEDVGGVALGEGAERSARPDGSELAVVADDDQLRPGALDSGEEAHEVDVGRHPALVEDDDVPVGERQAAVLEAPGERGDRARCHPGALAEVACRLAGGGGPDHLVAGGLEAGPHRRERGGLAGTGDPDHDVEAVTGGEKTRRHLPLGFGEPAAEALLDGGDRREGLVAGHLRAFVAGEALGELGDAGLVGEHAACRPPLLSASGHERQPDRVGVTEDRAHRVVEQRGRKAVQVRSRRDDHVGAGEGLLAGEASAGSEQLAGQAVEVDLVPLVGGAGGVDGGKQVRRRVAGGGEVGLPAGEEVGDGDVRLAVARGVRRDRSRRVGRVGADRRGDLRRALRVDRAGPRRCGCRTPPDRDESRCRQRPPDLLVGQVVVGDNADDRFCHTRPQSLCPAAYTPIRGRPRRPSHEQADSGTTRCTFSPTSKRRNGCASETHVKRGDRVVHGDKELIREARTQRPVPMRVRSSLSKVAACGQVGSTGPEGTITGAPRQSAAGHHPCGDAPAPGPGGTVVRPTIYTVERKGPGTISTMGRPRGGDWLVDEMSALRALGVGVRVSMLTASESRNRADGGAVGRPGGRPAVPVAANSGPWGTGEDRLPRSRRRPGGRGPSRYARRRALSDGDRPAAPS